MLASTCRRWRRVSASFDLAYMIEDLAHDGRAEDLGNDASRSSAGAASRIYLKDLGEEPGPVGFSLALGRGGWRVVLIWSLFAGQGLDDGAGRCGVFSLARLFNAVPGGVGAVVSAAIQI